MTRFGLNIHRSHIKRFSQCDMAVSLSTVATKELYSPHPKSDHEHCIICGESLSEDEADQHFGYVRINDRNREDRICEKCYNEFVVSGFVRS